MDGETEAINAVSHQGYTRRRLCHMGHEEPDDIAAHGRGLGTRWSL